jgi:hypothetical protein
MGSQNHHYVPQFLLANWCSADGRLTIARRVRGKLVFDRHAPEYTGFEPDLYTIASLGDDKKHWVETEVMAKLVDDPSAKCLARILSGEIDQLDANQRSVWARFIMAQWMRTPDRIAWLRRVSNDELSREFEKDTEAYLVAEGDAPEAT